MTKKQCQVLWASKQQFAKHAKEIWNCPVRVRAKERTQMPSQNLPPLPLSAPFIRWPIDLLYPWELGNVRRRLMAHWQKTLMKPSISLWKALVTLQTGINGALSFFRLLAQYWGWPKITAAEIACRFSLALGSTRSSQRVLQQCMVLSLLKSSRKWIRVCVSSLSSEPLTD